ncbi:MAG: hypothetical protein HGB19_05480 [Chlorobiales bacterium]|nr:hypothetical protein [Chlorobiales bacterium]
MNQIDTPCSDRYITKNCCSSYTEISKISSKGKAPEVKSLFLALIASLLFSAQVFAETDYTLQNENRNIAGNGSQESYTGAALTTTSGSSDDVIIRNGDVVTLDRSAPIISLTEVLINT